MKELGQWLRAAREAQDLSLAEVEAQTRIRQKFLAALESEEWDILPGDVTARGFLRKYAAFLGLDPQLALSRYQESLGPRSTLSVGEETPLAREVDYRPIELNMESEPARRLPWRALAGLAVLILLVAASWWVFRFRPGWITQALAAWPRLAQVNNPLAATDTPQPSPTPLIIRVTATPTNTPQRTPTPEPTTIPEASPTASPQESGPAQPTPTAADRPVEQLELQIEITGRAWVRVTVDGETGVGTSLEPGQQRSWQAQQSIGLRTGNAAGVQATLNGRPLGPLGGSGEVVELVWRLEGGRIVETTPTPTAAAGGQATESPPQDSLTQATATAAPSVVTNQGGVLDREG